MEDFGQGGREGKKLKIKSPNQNLTLSSFHTYSIYKYITLANTKDVIQLAEKNNTTEYRKRTSKKEGKKEQKRRKKERRIKNRK